MFDKYIDVILEIGLNLQPGERLHIRGQTSDWKLIHRITEKDPDLSVKTIRQFEVDAVFFAGIESIFISVLIQDVVPLISIKRRIDPVRSAALVRPAIQVQLPRIL